LREVVFSDGLTSIDIGYENYCFRLMGEKMRKKIIYFFISFIFLMPAMELGAQNQKKINLIVTSYSFAKKLIQKTIV
jgi:hypothetical protein